MNVNSIDMGEVYKLCIKTFGKDDTDDGSMNEIIEIIQNKFSNSIQIIFQVIDDIYYYTEDMSFNEVTDMIIDTLNECYDAKEYIFYDRNRYKEFIKDQENDKRIFKGTDENIIEGLIQCPNKECKQRKITFTTIQTRSADEAATNKFRCLKCGTIWYDD